MVLGHRAVRRPKQHCFIGSRVLFYFVKLLPNWQLSPGSSEELFFSMCVLSALGTLDISYWVSKVENEGSVSSHVLSLESSSLLWKRLTPSFFQLCLSQPAAGTKALVSRSLWKPRREILWATRRSLSSKEFIAFLERECLPTSDHRAMGLE